MRARLLPNKLHCGQRKNSLLMREHTALDAHKHYGDNFLGDKARAFGPVSLHFLAPLNEIHREHRPEVQEADP